MSLPGKKPKLKNFFTETARAVKEYRVLNQARDLLDQHTPRGNGQPVLIIPGYGGSDITSRLLRSFLESKGYAPYGWEDGVNLGLDDKTAHKMAMHLEAIYKKHGTKVALIGHSLGGIYARELARAYPHKVSTVITMGTPIGIGLNKNSPTTVIKAFFERTNPNNKILLGDDLLLKQILTPPDKIPTTSLYTRNDGIVHWSSCINPPAPLAENIEISNLYTSPNPIARASHTGLIINPLAFVVIADRLHYASKGSWKPFDVNDYPLFTDYFRADQAHLKYRPGLPQFTADEKNKIRPLFPF